MSGASVVHMRKIKNFFLCLLKPRTKRFFIWPPNNFQNINTITTTIINTITIVITTTKNLYFIIYIFLDSVQLHYFGVGAYLLPHKIFLEKFHRFENGELSLPHTLVMASFEVEVVRISDWWPVNNQKEREIAERTVTV